jgi:hypothetical protein
MLTKSLYITVSANNRLGACTSPLLERLKKRERKKGFKKKLITKN